MKNITRLQAGYFFCRVLLFRAVSRRFVPFPTKAPPHYTIFAPEYQ